MRAKRKAAICYSCGKKAEYTECSERCAIPEDARCKVLSGWLTVSYWKGMESVTHYDFCSFDCLQKWVDAQLPRVPEIFLKAFEQDENGA